MPSARPSRSAPPARYRASATSCFGRSAYTELYVTPDCWPEFREEELDKALEEYARRVRKFGGLVPENLRG